MRHHDLIPLCLTSENRVALDLLAVSHAIDEQLHKVMAFGEQAVTARPLSLQNPTVFRRSDLAAKAHWQRDGHPRELPPGDEHLWSHWCIKLNGNLERETNIKLTPSFEDSGMALMVRTIDVMILAKALRLPMTSSFCASSHSSRQISDLRMTPREPWLWVKSSSLHKPLSKLICHPLLCNSSHDLTLRFLPSTFHSSLINH